MNKEADSRCTATEQRQCPSSTAAEIRRIFERKSRFAPLLLAIAKPRRPPNRQLWQPATACVQETARPRNIRGLARKQSLTKFQLRRQSYARHLSPHETPSAQQAAVLCAAALSEQQAAVQLSQQSQSQAPGAQAQTPVAQQPQQSQGVLQAHGALFATTPATAIEPASAADRIEPIRNLNMLQSPRETVNINKDTVPEGGNVMRGAYVP